MPKKTTRQKRQTDHLPPDSSNRDVQILASLEQQLLSNTDHEEVRLSRAFLHACRFLLDKGFRDPIRVSLQQVSTAIGRSENMAGIGSEGGKWMYSIIQWASVERQGDKQALRVIPVLFQIDCAFFLCQPWIRERLVDWHKQGDEKKIHHAFFGTTEGKPGVRGYQLVKDNFRRDRVVVEAVIRQLQGGCGYRQAMEKVAKDSQKGRLDIREGLSAANVRRIYEKVRDKSTDHRDGLEDADLFGLLTPLTSLFSPPDCVLNPPP